MFVTFLVVYAIYPGKGGHSTAVQIVLGEFYRYYSAYKYVCICFEYTIECSIFCHISDLINIHGFIVNLFFK